MRPLCAIKTMKVYCQFDGNKSYSMYLNSLLLMSFGKPKTPFLAEDLDGLTRACETLSVS